jgi:hypothetical protein
MAGGAPGDLKVHVVGPRYDTIEAFFKNELFYRETLAGAVNLHCGDNIFLAPANSYGTFAVRYGACGNSIKVYGWKRDQEKPEFRSVTFEAGQPVQIRWITTRILKVTYGSNFGKEYILRFNDSDVPWTVLYASP